MAAETAVPDPATLHARLEAWHAQGLDRRQPLRVHAVAAMLRRADGLQGAPREALLQRADALAQALDAVSGTTAPDTAARPAAPGPLGALAQAMHAGHAATPYPELPALDAFRRLWSAVRIGSQVRRSLAKTSDDAGPLNSSRLVHRSLTLMRQVSPEYLQHFLAYVDTLSGLAQLQEAGALPGQAAPAPGGKPRARGKPRRRRAEGG
ncbi:DUF2894 domain-containing protein [Luteimonas sp. FCS-9]|uniref:DUF2894 domain-containing protein n=1 Tax=Luteimonas sp. FCS-9 TaxID=1547516 RepID=UPI00063E92FC|nr:DUF2894 domain-containing protein [Luteimonas sp. FCS-9]KLI98985.1 hypothetical protein WQ56_13515 [Luteimonas sp. FCS-9]